MQGIEALENYLDPPKPGESNEETAHIGLDPPSMGTGSSTPSTVGKPTQEKPPPIVWRKGKHGKDIHYDPAKDRVISSLFTRTFRTPIASFSYVKYFKKYL